MRKLGCAVLTASLLVLWPGAAPASASPATAVLAGHVTRRVRISTRVGRVPSDENVSLSLVVNIDQDLMRSTLDGIYGPKAPRKKRFLTSAEFIEKFDIARKRRVLKAYAEAAGLTVDPHDEPGSLVVKVSGPARLVEKAFGVQLNRYRAANGQVFRGIESDPVVPAALAEDLHAVLGLTNYAGVAKPHFVRGKRISGGGGTAPSPASARPSSTQCENTDPISCPGSGPGGALSPADIRSIYGLSLPLTGAGQTVAVMELDGYAQSDITAYETNTQLFATNPNVTVTWVPVDSQANTCGAYTGTTPYQNLACNSTTEASDGGMDEVALDIEMVISLSSGVSSIRVYGALNSSQGILDAYALIASNNSAKSVSTSWGLDEIDSGGAFMTSEASTFEQMAANGQTIYAAAGDAGAYDNDGVSTPVALVTDDPASQPY
ncbi:MAG TPA: protease pro-enzyme activation domain-containing protein, partial [Elusimicrobiota bacterium]|nr:protease pro-enzyme activation domain-containing protein [Elusimicrobiota bacterium]